jgi:hydrogenase nickel incorporation protein HypA/HybF
MHEMALAESVWQLVEETACREKASRVKTIVLEIGRLSAVVPEALRFCFEAVAEGSLTQGAALEIIEIPGAGYCQQCGKTFGINEFGEACPACGSYRVQPTAGSEMRVKEIEIAS